MPASEILKVKISKWKPTSQNSGDIFSEDIMKDVIQNFKPKDFFDAEQIGGFEKFLLSGPEMTDDQYNYVQEKRNHFNEWK